MHATSDPRAVFKGLLAAHLCVQESALETRVFPDSSKAAPLGGLVQTARAVG